MKKIFLILLIVLSGVSCEIYANALQKVEKTVGNGKAKSEDKIPNETKILADIQNFFNKLVTLKAKFIQIDKNGNTEQGYLWIKRPNLMKMSYPSKVIVIKDDHMTVYDKELKEKTETAVYSSPLSFILERHVDLKKNLKILAVAEGDDFISVKLCKKGKEEEGAIVLLFSKKDMELLEWMIFKAASDENPRTRIALLERVYKEDISNDVFDSFD